ncbi:hypothetical protein FDECE_3137 [Fusarium decemcellulare]|nr:hypothetical protein FDECE_3137 [Fusarium decemcellulare]
MASTSKTYLITGANRGIGKGFTEKLLQRPGSTVVAAVRDPIKAATSLNVLSKAETSSLIIIKLDAKEDNDAAAAISQLQEDHGITAIDVVIANAGVAHSGSPVTQNSPEALRHHFNINTIGPVILLQAAYPLLKAAKAGNPMFLAMSTGIGSIATQKELASLPAAFSPYGASKAALDWLVNRVHYEEPWLTTWVVHPGIVLTDMSDTFTSNFVDPVAAGGISVEASVSGILKQVDESTRERYGGSFRSHDGSILPW